jgi:calcineurin-like phosphoesterase family protein
MPNIFVISDTHFDHANILTFKRKDGSPLREFKDVNHMNEMLIQNWNSVVRPQDKVYHLGDLTMHKQLPEAILNRLNGHKRLVRGNHDVAPTKDYLKWFEEIYACRVIDHMLFTHIPVHHDCIGRFVINIHGHVHANSLPHPRYYNVSVENINYTPVSIEDLKKKIKVAE